MKKLMFITLCSILFISCAQTTNSSANTTANFKVWGNCNMCKETIEGSLKIEGVSRAEWDTESKQIVVSYDSTIIVLDAIQKHIASVGYDNDKYNGDETAYNNLHECCKYERKP